MATAEPIPPETEETDPSPANPWAEIPFAPKRWPFFYGWAIVAVSTVTFLASLPGQTMGVGVFSDSLVEALGLSRLQLTTAYMFGTIGSSLILPLAGRMIDRWGSRVMVVLSAIGLGASMLVFSQSDRLAWPGGTGAWAWLVPFGAIFFCFLLLRFFGQGCLTVVSRVVLGKWFNHRRGLATAISGVFRAIGFNTSPLLLNWMVVGYGWRYAAIALGAVIGIGVAAVSWLFYRDNPEECGLEMDGVADEDWHRRMAERVPETRREFTRGEAMRTGAFWVFSLGMATMALMITALTFHVAAIGQEKGIDRDTAYRVFVAMPIFGITANFAGGWLADRIRMKWLLIVMMAGQILGTTAIFNFGDPIGRWALTAGYGTALGLWEPIQTVSLPRFFGRRHLGAISGLNMSIMVFASAIGPVLFSAVERFSHSYMTALAGCLVMPVVIILLALRTENPQWYVEAEG